MAEKTVGTLNNVLKFKIDSASWKNLDKFQARLSSVKKQMQGMSGAYSLKATGANAAIRQAKKISDMSMDIRLAAYKTEKLKQANLEKKTSTQAAKDAAREQAKAAKLEEKNKRNILSQATKQQKQLQAAERSAYAEKLRLQRKADKVQAADRQKLNLAELRYIKLQESTRNAIAKKDIQMQERMSRLQGMTKTHKVDMGAANSLQGRYKAASAMLLADPTQMGKFKVEVAQIESGLKGLSSGAKRSGIMGIVTSLGALRLGVASVAATIMGAGVGAFYHYTKQLQNMKAMLFSVSGSAQQAAKDLNYAFQENQRLGVSMNTIGESIAKLSFAGGGILDAGQIKELTSGFLEMATVAGATQDKQERGLYAIQNMLGKRKIQSEELFGQLGEQIPYMLQAFEEAIDTNGMTLRQYSDEHKGISIDVLPLVAKKMHEIANRGGALANSLQRIEVVEGAVSGKFSKFMGEIGEKIGPSIIMGLKLFDDLMDGLAPILVQVAGALNVIVYTFLLGARTIAAAFADFVEMFALLWANPTRFIQKMSGMDTNKKNLSDGRSEAHKGGMKDQEIKVMVETNLGELSKFISVKAEVAQKAVMQTIFGNLSSE